MTKQPHKHGRQRGFTLVELMIVIVIAAILLSIAAPSFEETIKRNRRLTSLEDTLGTLATARTEAVSRATPVAICPSSDGSACAGNWEDGVIMFEDDGAGAGTAEDGDRSGDEELIRIAGAYPNGITVRSGGSFTDTGTVIFDELGAVADNGTLIICDEDGVQEARGVVINLSGQPRLAVDENDPADGIVNDDRGAGNNVVCP